MHVSRHKARLVFFDNVYMYDINAIPHMTEESPYNPPSRKGCSKKTDCPDDYG